MGWLRRVAGDLRKRRNIDAHALTVVAVLYALVSLFSDRLDDDFRWAVLLSGLGLLIYRSLPDETPEMAEGVLYDRSVYDTVPAASLFAGVRDVRVFAPSAVNLLSAQTCEILRNSVLRRENGRVRIVVLDPREEASVRQASRQLDESVEFPVQRLPAALETTMERLRLMSRWKTAGAFDYRLLSYSPGFSLVLLDPDTPAGRVIVEIHGFHNLSTSSRMHLELTRGRDERWYGYWVEQFDHIWNAARHDVLPVPVLPAETAEAGERALQNPAPGVRRT
ncbi:hypothetical protein ACFYY8_16345 [Streptosporangium sp. NPDC001559]|uniref:hypothetical protein n=1 Tax=Streptosporangium sp. NPDC001559 TaxID=3366187 RepID=UPI0036EF13CB